MPDDEIGSGSSPRHQWRTAMSILNDLAHLVLTTASDAIVAADRDGLIRFWNPGAERIFGFSSAEAVGQSLDLIIPERQRGRHWEGYREVMRTGESRYDHGDLLSVPSIRKDGARISVEFTIIPLKDAEGRMEGMSAIMRDVTKRFEEMRMLRHQLAAARKAEMER
jgi:PAS domain S-box-containing protein